MKSNTPLILALLFLVLTGCTFPGGGPEPTDPPAATASPTLPPTSTSVPPTFTASPTPEPTATSVPTDTPQPSDTAVPALSEILINGDPYILERVEEGAYIPLNFSLTLEAGKRMWIELEGDDVRVGEVVSEGCQIERDAREGYEGLLGVTCGSAGEHEVEVELVDGETSETEQLRLSFTVVSGEAGQDGGGDGDDGGPGGGQGGGGDQGG